MVARESSAWCCWRRCSRPHGACGRSCARRLDALPDLSDVQVIIRTSYPGQAPQLVENQITYPLTTTMLSVPGRKGGARVFVVRRLVCLRAVRRRHRSVLGALPVFWSTLNQAQSRLPRACAAALGRTQPESAGSTNTPSSIEVADWICRAARVAGLVSRVRAEIGAGRGGGRNDRRHRAPVSGGARP